MYSIPNIDVIGHARGNFPESFYPNKKFQNYFLRLSKLMGLPQKSSEITNIFNFFALHYLSKSAQYPLNYTKETAALACLEYYQIGNPTYYRYNGSGTYVLFEDLLKSLGYDFLFDTSPDMETIVVKTPKFKKFLKGEYEVKKGLTKEDAASFLTYESRLNEMQNNLGAISSRGSKTLVDITHVISQDELLDPAVLRERLNQLRTFMRSNPYTNVALFGTAKLATGQYVCFAIEKEPSPIEKTQTVIVKKDIFSSLCSLGYRPDLVEIKKSLIQMGAGLSSLAAKIPSSHSSSQEIKTSAETILARLDALQIQSSTLQTKFYYELLLNVCLFLTDKLQKDPENELIISQSFKEIEDLLIHASKTDDYEEFLSYVDLIFEEFNLLVNFIPEVSLKEQVINLTTVEGRAPQCELYTSGMNAYMQLFLSLSSSQPKEKLKTFFADDNYFELRYTLIPHAQRKIEATIQPLSDQIDYSQYDVICGDLYPNDAPKNSVDKHNFVQIISPEQILNRNKPLTMIIDTATTLIFDKEVQNLVKLYDEPIQKGMLNLVFTSSLQKFSSCGFDKFPAGITIAYNNRDCFENFNKQLGKHAQKEPLSRESQNYFSLFFNTGEEIKKYLTHINNNTEKFYQELHFLQNDPSSRVILAEKRDSSIPMISIHFDPLMHSIGALGESSYENMCSILREYYLILARQKGLPISKRSSFGFAHANINEAGTAIRMTVGLEEAEMIERYAQVWKKIDDQLRLLKVEELAEIKKVIESPDFSKNWAQVQSTLTETSGDKFIARFILGNLSL